MQRTRKSQMEILGLAFVFVILIFGLIIFLRLGGTGPEQRSKYVDPQLAASIVSSMLRTSVQCDDFYTYSVTDLLKDCAGPNMIECNDEDSCQVANNTMLTILSETLVKYAKSYHFVINTTYSNNNITLNHTQNCKERSQGIFYRQPFDVSGKTLFINLRICD